MSVLLYISLAFARQPLQAARKLTGTFPVYVLLTDRSQSAEVAAGAVFGGSSAWRVCAVRDKTRKTAMAAEAAASVMAR